MVRLAAVLEEHGRDLQALEVWRRSKFDSDVGVGDGTVQYRVGALLQRLGREEEAIEALRRAADSRSRSGSAGGAPVAPAARDRLADLGALR